jgi:hypothetical protein
MLQVGWLDRDVRDARTRALELRGRRARRRLAKLWPHRQHESGAFRNLLCCFRLHRWAQLNLAGLVPDSEEVWFCRWCSKVRVNGTVYGGGTPPV